MSATHLYSIGVMAMHHAEDARLPLFVRRHWAHMASGWIRRSKIANRIAQKTNEQLYYTAYIPPRFWAQK